MDIQRSYSKNFKFITKLRSYLTGQSVEPDIRILDHHIDDVLDHLAYLQTDNHELNFSMFKIFLCNKVVDKLTKLGECN